MACHEDGSSVSMGDECKVWWEVGGIGALDCPFGIVLFCLGVLSRGFDVLGRLGLGCSS